MAFESGIILKTKLFMVFEIRKKNQTQHYRFCKKEDEEELAGMA